MQKVKNGRIHLQKVAAENNRKTLFASHFSERTCYVANTVIVAAASHRVPFVIDGFISGAAALMAVELNPLISEYLLAGHASVERGHRLILERLGLSPLLDLQLRLGEGTGAVLAMSIIEAALHAHSEMATFEEAGVSTREEK